MNRVISELWWVKIILKVVFSRLPISYRWWSRLGIFKHGKMNAGEYSINVFRKHLERSDWGNELRNKVVLELGPGDGVASAIIASAYGGRSILVDVGKFADGEVSAYCNIAKQLSELGLNPPDLSTCRSLSDILSVCKATYLTDGLASLQQIESQSVDMIFSQAVLEHVKLEEFGPIMDELRRIVKPTGFCTHRIDLKDHLSGGLNNLRFSRRVWESDFLSRSGFYTNRLRYNPILNIIKDAGFQIKVVHVDRWTTLPLQKEKMSAEFRLIPEEELLISGFDIVLYPVKKTSCID